MKLSARRVSTFLYDERIFLDDLIPMNVSYSRAINRKEFEQYNRTTAGQSTVS